jgi:hypothetical protein
MSRFHRDTDLESFDSKADVTAGKHHNQPSPLQSTSEVKCNSAKEDEEAAMASLRKRMAGREYLDIISAIGLV